MARRELDPREALTDSHTQTQTHKYTDAHKASRVKSESQSDEDTHTITQASQTQPNTPAFSASVGVRLTPEQSSPGAVCTRVFCVVL